MGIRELMKRRKGRKKMAKIIKLTPEYIDKACEEIKATAAGRLTDGKVSYVREFTLKDQKARLLFTPKAWVKMLLLLDHYESEVGWYCVADRLGEEENNEYLVSDIIVYPQTVTSATVEMADEEVQAAWKMEKMILPDGGFDERFFNLSGHGHSHVRMSTSPSKTDLDHQKEILDGLPEDGFYIFMIYNKSLSRTLKIYDLKKNVMFEDKDITVGFYEEDESYDEFMDEADRQVKKQTWKPATPKTPVKSTPASSAPATPAAPAAKTVTPAAKPASSSKPVQGMGWRGAGHSSFYNYDDENDEYYDSWSGQWIDGDTYRYMLKHGWAE